jgi:hypothetical protein
MTRINVAIPPQQLTNKHLIAEHREIKRVPNLITRGRYNLKSIPPMFTLGKGHVAFFYDKLLYLKNRYEEIYQECLSRGFNMTYYGSAWNEVPLQFMNDYTPTERDEQIIRQRIKEKLDKTWTKEL